MCGESTRIRLATERGKIDVNERQTVEEKWFEAKKESPSVYKYKYQMFK